MYKCLLVDDEPRICYGMKELIEWDQYDFTLVDIAVSSNEALKKAFETHYQLVVTDIKMPGMDGLELIQKLKEINPDIRFIIMSGYSEFEYAKRAIDYGVKSYLLKPVDEVLLMQQLCLIKEEIDKENKERNSKEKYSEMAIEKVLRNYYIGNISDEGAKELAFAAGIDLQSYPVLLVVLIPNSDYLSFLKEIDIDSIKKVINGNIGLDYDQKVFVLDRSKSVVGTILYNIPDVAELKNNLERINLKLNNSMPQLRYHMVISPSIKEVEEIEPALGATFAKCRLLGSSNIKPQRIEYVVVDSHKHQAVITQIIDYVNKHYCEGISLKAIAKQFYINPVYLGRLFKQTIGMGFVDYINMLRIDYAVELLKNEKYKMEQVSKQVGYSDKVYFYKKFKELKGVSPTSCNPNSNSKIQM